MIIHAIYAINVINYLSDVMRQSLVKLESELSTKHQRQMDLQKQAHIKECQTMLEDFEQAQTLYKQQLQQRDQL